MAKKKKVPTPMEKLTAGYEAFIKGKETHIKGRELFDKVVKKSVKPRSSK